MPLVRSLGHGLWEVRSDLQGGRTARVIFSVERGCLLLLHAFLKTSRTTPSRDLALARRRHQGSR